MNSNAPTARRDAPAFTPARAWAGAIQCVTAATRDPERILPRAVAEWARTYGDATALVSASERLSFQGLAARMNQYSRWALGAGVTSGESLALIMGNRPEYFAIWLGLVQIGAIVALVSPDLPPGALRHAFKVVEVRRVVAAGECAEACAEAAEGLEHAIEIWTDADPWPQAHRIDRAVSVLSGEPLTDSERRPVTLPDRALRIFTSGTTGLPKAAEVSHRRIVVWAHWFAGLAGMTASDRLYNCLPMHHSVGGVVAVASPLVFGGSVAIAERFSARRFWDDVRLFECTAFQYIGELCRYLVAAPPAPAEKDHKLRIAIGNGLAPDIWRACVDRFGPLRVLEFYASTEGNIWFYNVEGRIGSIGRLPPYLAVKNHVAIVQFDRDAQAPVRGADGFCVPCVDGKVGEAIGRISEEPSVRFEGYSDVGETEKKILRNVFAAGDAWMRTGDLMRRDTNGFYFFSDRIGDTFRWKGENVATLEVAAVLAACPGVAEAIVYGVSVPDADGRAGMAAVKTDGRLDLDVLVRHLDALPRYARPLFLRLVSRIESTETFKPRRRVYVEEAFDPERVKDPLYVLDSDRRTYVTLDADRYAAIQAGVMRL